MYPYEIIFGLTLYDILIAAGVAAAILLFSYLADKRGIKKKLQSLVMACTLCALAGGWFFAVLTHDVLRRIRGRRGVLSAGVLYRRKIRV